MKIRHRITDFRGTPTNTLIDRPVFVCGGDPFCAKTQTSQIELPAAQMSVRSSSTAIRHCSGAMYNGGPLACHHAGAELADRRPAGVDTCSLDSYCCGPSVWPNGTSGTERVEPCSENAETEARRAPEERATED
ncbi:hypothetical protein ACFL5O_07730 [Myxococcota bacterium]